jgi:hypothetical protein
MREMLVIDAAVRIDRTVQVTEDANEYFCVDRSTYATSPCVKAYAVAAARVETSSLMKMLLT